MSEYEYSILIDAPAEEIFAFVSDLNNLPKFLPTTHYAEPQSSERVIVRGEADGNYYESDGWVRVNPTEFFMEWGSDGHNFYTGWLEIEEVGELSEVTVHISFQPKLHVSTTSDENSPGRDRANQQGLKAAMQSIRNLVEGTGGKVEPQIPNKSKVF